MLAGLRWFVNRRSLLLQLVVAIGFVYLVLDKASTQLLSKEQHQATSSSDAVAEVSAMPRSGGNVNMMLSLNIKGIMRFLDVHTEIVDARSLSSDPGPPAVEILMQPKPCQKESNLTWLICVHSRAQDGGRRELMRQSWASSLMFAQHNTRVVFFVGNTSSVTVQKWIKKEDSWYGDLVQVGVGRPRVGGCRATSCRWVLGDLV